MVEQMSSKTFLLTLWLATVLSAREIILQYPQPKLAKWNRWPLYPAWGSLGVAWP